MKPLTRLFLLMLPTALACSVVALPAAARAFPSLKFLVDTDYGSVAVDNNTIRSHNNGKEVSFVGVDVIGFSTLDTLRPERVEYLVNHSDLSLSLWL